MKFIKSPYLAALLTALFSAQYIGEIISFSYFEHHPLVALILFTTYSFLILHIRENKYSNASYTLVFSYCFFIATILVALYTSRNGSIMFEELEFIGYQLLTISTYLLLHFLWFITKNIKRIFL